MVQALIANSIENLKRFRLMLRELGVSLERRHWDEAGPVWSLNGVQTTVTA